MKTKLLIFLFLAGCIIPNLLFAQFIQQGPKLVGTGAVGNADQGRSVAISSDGNTAIVGGYGDNNYVGAVWVFTRTGGIWTQQGTKLIGTGGVGFTNQGTSVAISLDGNTAIEGGIGDAGVGAVWVFTRSNGVWTQQGSKLVGTGAVGNTYQGYSVAISSDGNTVIEGGYGDSSNSGAVWVFTRVGGIWTQQGPKLIGTGTVGNSVQGNSVAISSDGNTAIEGGPADNNSAGAFWVFIRNGSVWSQQGPKLTGIGAVGSQVNQGWSLAISSDGNTAIEGGQNDNSIEGAAWIFTRSGGIWTQQGPKLFGTGAVGNTHQGYSVAISSDGNTAIEGGAFDNNSTGAIWVFTRSAGVWTQQGLKLVGTGGIGSFVDQGTSISISSDGNTTIEGGPGDNNQAGAFWVFYNSTLGVTPISGEVPKNFSLLQNYPNPFNPTTVIKFNIPLLRGVAESRGVSVQLKIYDILGKEVSILVNQQLLPGTYEAEWNASNLPSGVYFYKLIAGDYVETKKMVLVK